ncbi:MAG: hypothetical protein B6D46_05915 [Polyangiaceae bacterium UTPRO1]|jgi:hypothetical protein|nr:hypothetical protein [Myxococcales bacterium]OQY67559.1 MAG: hypothetical protein B6D46_05915 [Polyangiaceae bacterium UTPRO1]
MPAARRRTLHRLALAALFAFMAFVVWRTFHLQGVRCEVCITFADRSRCATVDGERAADARQAAIGNACSFLASGVTDSIACSRTPPTKDLCTAPD